MSEAKAEVWSLQQLHDYYESIPTELWCTKTIGDAGGPRCAVGHWITLGRDSTCPVVNIDTKALVRANDLENDLGPRQNVLDFLVHIMAVGQEL